MSTPPFPPPTSWDAGYSAALELLAELGAHPELIAQVKLRRDEQHQHATSRDRMARRQEQELRARAARACTVCDDHGYLPTGHLCTHDPRAGDRIRRGVAAARAALTAKARPYTAPQTEETPR